MTGTTTAVCAVLLANACSDPVDPDTRGLSIDPAQIVIEELGAHVEAMDEVQIAPTPTAEKGLAVKIVLDGHAPLRPGEIVNVSLRVESAPTASVGG